MKAKLPTSASRSQKAAATGSVGRLRRAQVATGLQTELQLVVFREGQPGTLDSGSPAGLGSHDDCSAVGQLPKHTQFPYLQKGGGGAGGAS